ncbi:hypothetical protein EDD21DRAFT_373989 [Dissophora ornata]|nr:hypothetical protein EDD21DRAFT_373989 [Dissophora ornata]
MTPLKPHFDPYKRSGARHQGRSRHPLSELSSSSPPPSSRYLGAADIDPNSRRQGSRTPQRSVNRQRLSPLSHSRHHNHRPQHTPGAKASALPPFTTQLAQEQEAQENVQTRLLSSSSQTTPYLGLLYLQGRLSEFQNRQQHQAMQQDRLRRAFSESSDPKATEVLRSGEGRVERARTLPPTHEMQIMIQNAEIGRNKILNRVKDKSESGVMAHTEMESVLDSQTVPHVERPWRNGMDLEVARRKREEAMQMYYEAAQALRRAQEREEALMFEQEMHFLREGQRGMGEYSGGISADQESLFSAESRVAPSACEYPPLFPQQPQQHMRHLQDSYQLRQQQPQQVPRTTSSPVQVREFIQSPSMTLPRTTLTPTMQVQGCDTETRRELSSSNSTGVVEYLLQLESTADPFQIQPKVQDNSCRVGEARALFQRYPVSPNVKVKSEERDTKLGGYNNRGSKQEPVIEEVANRRHSEKPSLYMDYDVPIEIQSTEESLSVAGSQWATNHTGGASDRSVRWRSPTPLPVRPKDQQEALNSPRPLSAQLSTSNHDDYAQSCPRSPMQYFPRIETPGVNLPCLTPIARSTSSSSIPHNAPHLAFQAQPQATDQNEAESSNRNTSSSRFAEFLESLSHHPCYRHHEGHACPPLVYYAPVEYVEHYHISK